MGKSSKKTLIVISIFAVLLSMSWELLTNFFIAAFSLETTSISKLLELYGGVVLGIIIVLPFLLFFQHMVGQLEELEISVQKQLEESEQRYKSLFKYNQSATFTLDVNGHFTLVNNSTVEIMGYAVDELIGSSILPFIYKPNLESTTQSLTSVLDGNSEKFETVILHKTGKLVYLTVNFVPIIVTETLVGVIGIAHDDTNEKLAELKLQESEKRYRSLINLSPEVIFVHSRERIEFVNDKAFSFIGISDKHKIIGRTIFEFLHPDDRQVAAYDMALSFKKTDELPIYNELRFQRNDGKIIITKVGANIIQYNGEPALLGVIHDITKEKESGQRLEEANKLLLEMSQLDGLTGIPNRRYYEKIFENEWKSAVRNSSSISLIMLDIDYFKNYNDTYGHQLGDHCLKQVANALQASLNRPRDFVSRYGGEEFSVILPETDIEGAKFVAETLRAKVESLAIPHKGSKVKGIVTVSIGVATIIPTKDSDYKFLVEKTDKALYEAKKHGRNQVWAEREQG